MDMFDKKEDVEHVAVSIDNTIIAENDYNLSVSSYVQAKDNREKINIAELNEEVSKTVEKINTLRADIDKIIKEIEA
jgi:type I restriction enzyme M protein